MTPLGPEPTPNFNRLPVTLWSKCSVARSAMLGRQTSSITSLLPALAESSPPVVVLNFTAHMSKKDRIAVAISVFYIFCLIVWLFDGLKPPGLAIFSLPLFIYWGYRFVKNDISFLPNKPDDNS